MQHVKLLKNNNFKKLCEELESENK
jgi:hypothetical protein